MEILVNHELAAFWSTVLSALEMATYVFGGIFILLFLLMGLMEFHERTRPGTVVPPGGAEPSRIARSAADTVKPAQSGSVDSRHDDC